MIIKIKVFNEKGFVKEDKIDLSEKLKERGISNTTPQKLYLADNINHFGAISGGQISPPQNVNKVDKTTGSIEIFNKPISVNIKIRYDRDEPPETRWNINVYVDIDDPSFSWQQKRLITKHPKRVHKIADSNYIRVEYWINGIEQTPIESLRQKH